MTMPDGLRAVAALLVILPHSGGYFGYWPVPSALTQEVVLMSSLGAGFRIFFVISGFVIAYSLRNAYLTPRRVGVYLFRRMVRLTPPYWAAIALMLFFMLARSVTTGQWVYLPSVKQLLINLTYSHDLIGVDSIIGVSWTLCIEVQLYVVFCGLLCGLQMLSRVKAWPRAWTAPRVVWLTWLVSLGWPAGIYPHANGWFFDHWFAFAAGASVWWAVERRLPPLLVGLTLAASYASGVYAESFSAGISSIAAIALFAAGMLGRLGTWLSAGPLQWIAKISYSLYLVHMTVIAWMLALMTRYQPTNEAASYVFLSVSYLVSLLGAVTFYQCVERPSFRLSKALKREHLTWATVKRVLRPVRQRASGFALRQPRKGSLRQAV